MARPRRSPRPRAIRTAGYSAWEMAAIRMKSYARVKKAANVEANGT